MSFDAENIIPPGAKIKVVGVGGGGGNAVNTMIKSQLEGVEFIAANTDVQALRSALPEKKIQLGKELTKGLGAGADPDIGRDAALEDRQEIQEALAGADMVFITAGMGGGTGTGGASVIAQIARDMGALTVAVITKPFHFEGKRRRRHAELGLERLRENVDTLITIPNQRLLQIATPDLSMVSAFRMADDVLVNAVKGISDIINIPGTVNVDFADVKAVMSCMGMALMGIGSASGENRAAESARQAIKSPLLEDIDIEGATGILINITAGENLSLMEVNEACSIVQDAAHEDANVIFGAVIDEEIGDDMRVTVIATGFPVEKDQDFNSEPAGRKLYKEQTRQMSQQYRAPAATQRTYSPVVAPVEEAPVARPLEAEQKPEPVVAQTPPSQAVVSEDVAIEPEPVQEPVATQQVESPVQTASAGFVQGDLAFFDEIHMKSEQAETPVEEATLQQEQASVENNVEEEPQDSIFEEERPGVNFILPYLDSEEEPLAASSADQDLAEAEALAEKLVDADGQPRHEDDLDVPAYIRHGMKDLSLD